MKKLILVCFVFLALTSKAQTNLQVQYDLGNARKHITTTLEMFKPDKWGDSFFFVDMEFNNGPDHHPSLGYMEIARVLKFWKAPLGVHVEYNGGLLLSGAAGFPINNAYLAGVDYAWHDQSFSKFVNLKLMYKNIQGKNPASFQITGVWNLNYFKNKLSLSGFADFWREDNTNFLNASGDALAMLTHTRFVFIAEPQIWYNLNENLSLGGEVEIATNFGSVDGLKICPAIGAKWKF